jgi:hypothetical protein
MPQLNQQSMDWCSTNNVTKIYNGKRNFNSTNHCRTILFKLRSINKGGMMGQNALKGNMVSFAQDHEHAVELLNELPLSL